MSDKYCPAGKFECSRMGFCNPVVFGFKVCPWEHKEIPAKKSLADKFMHVLSTRGVKHSEECKFCEGISENFLSSVVECPTPEEVTWEKIMKWVGWSYMKNGPIDSKTPNLSHREFVDNLIHNLKTVFAGIHREAKERNNADS